MRIRNFSNGLYVNGPVDDMPEGTLRIAKSVSPLSQRSVKSRNGSSSLIALTVNQAYYFNDLWWYFLSASENIQVGDTNSIGTAIAGSLGSTRPTFTPAPPTSGVQDWLFVCAEDKLIKFSQADDDVVVAGVYQWTASGSGTNEYYLESSGGGDPGVTNSPEYVVEDAASTPNVMSIGTIGALTAGQWVFGDNDALGYNTIYVRLSDNTDPDTKSDSYVAFGRGFTWGVEAPTDSPALATGGAGLTGDYKYHITYANTRTGSRSNSDPAASVDISLLLHLNNNTTDSSNYTHTVTNTTGTFDAADKKFGTHSWEGDGTNDYLTCPHHPVLNFEGDEFTVDFWFDSDSPDVAKTHHWLFCKYQDASNYWGCRLETRTSPSGDRLFMESVVNGNVEFNYGVDVGDLVQGTFHHVAILRGWENDPRGLALIYDGTMQLYIYYTGWIGNTGDLGIGGHNGTTRLDGHIDEFRVTKGRALWTGNFDVPTVEGVGDNTITLANQGCTLSSIPASGDNQVDRIEIWRTVAGGDVYFYNTSVDAGTTSYTDTLADADLSGTVLPTDNTKPSAWFDDSYYHNASMFWITRNQAGQRGRVHYSPIGRCESVQGFINVTSDDDILQRVIGYAGNLFAISESGVWQILGTNPYTAKRVPGIPGTTKPHTVTETPVGPIWEAEDGVHLFRGGTTGEYIAIDPVRNIFRGETSGGIAGFTGTIATYGRGEYLISDGTTTLALDVYNRKWREPGLAATALAYSRESDQILLGITNKALDFEKEGQTADDSATFTFTVETPQLRSESDSDVIVQHVTVDADTTNEVLTATLVYDDAQTLSLGNVQNNGRALAELPVGRACRNFGLKLSGSIDAAVEVFEIKFDIHNPMTEGK